MDIFVARQPILNEYEQVAAYELLYRSSEANAFPDINHDQATIEVLIHSFITIGAEKIAQGRPCFVNFTESLLLQRVAENFSPHQIVIEILEHVPITEKLIELLRELREKGYTIALDDFVCQKDVQLYDELFGLVSYIKVDFLLSAPAERQAIEQKVKRRFPHVALLAEKVETREMFEQAKKAGYTFFQGYFFAKPQMIRSTEIKANALSYFQLIQLLQQEEIDIDRIARAIEKDVGLSYQLLKLINSPALRTKSKVKSIRQAIMMLGLIELTKWLYVLALRKMKENTGGRMKEVMESALFRAKVCEQLAKAKQAGNASEFFLAGMFSLVDVLLHCEVELVLGQIPLSEQVNDTLLGRRTSISPYLELAVALDEVKWEAISAGMLEIKMEASMLQKIYEEARLWAASINETAE